VRLQRFGSWLVICGSLLGCAGEAARPRASTRQLAGPSTSAPARPPAAGAKPVRAAAASIAHYVVDASNLEHLSVSATFPAGSSQTLRVADGSEAFISNVREQTAGAEQPLAADREGFTPRRCKDGCQVSYAFALGDAAQRLKDPEAAERFAAAFVSPSSSWLLGAADQLGYSLEVRTTAPNVFLSAFPALDAKQPSVAVTSPGSTIYAPFAGLGAWRVHTLRVSDAQITLGIAGDGYATTDDELVRWLEQTWTPLADYYAGLAELRPLILVVPGTERVHGVTLGNGGSSVLLHVGSDVTAAEALGSWVPTHEFIHVLFPSVAPRLPWIEEGLATYVEPLVRLRAGRVSVQQFWGDLARGLPQGLPQSGDRGLDNTRTWGRTYWGGALYWLLVDVRLHERTQNQRSVQDALRAILHAGGNVSVDWPLDRILSVADLAAQGSEFRDTYAQMARAPWAPDLRRLFADLGVIIKGERVVFNDNARLAKVRTSITSSAGAKYASASTPCNQGGCP
jgi:hypothetical protein